MVFWREKPYDRERSLAAAAKAQAGGRIRKAIDHYNRVLDADPDDYLVHAKIAPLLARVKRFDEASESFRIAASRHLEAGFGQKAIAIYSQAAKLMPWVPDIWEAIAQIHVKQGKHADAVQTLFNGQRFCRKGPDRDRAISMLRKAFALEPWNFEVTFELAGLVRKKDPVETIGLLQGLSSRVKGRRLRKVRSAMFFAQPGFTMAWRWFKAAWAAA